MVDERDGGVDADAGGQLPAADRAGLGQGALAGVDHRPQPQRLGDHCVEVGVVSRRQLLAQTGEDARVARQEIERESKAGRGRLVAGEQHRHQLVPQLDISHRLAVLIASAQ